MKKILHINLTLWLKLYIQKNPENPKLYRFPQQLGLYPCAYMNILHYCNDDTFQR